MFSIWFMILHEDQLDYSKNYEFEVLTFPGNSISVHILLFSDYLHLIFSLPYDGFTNGDIWNIKARNYFWKSNKNIWMRISIFYYFVISTVLPDSNAAALFDDMNWSNILHAFGLDDDDHRDHFLPMMTYTGQFWLISLFFLSILYISRLSQL